MADKMFDKVSKLLAQAENARSFGTPEGDAEADAFMAKAVQMAAANSIDLAVARLHRAKREGVQEVERDRRIETSPRNRKQNRKHFVDLANAIVETNDCDNLIARDDTAVFVTGFPDDIDVVQALFTHLSVEMVSECEREIKEGKNRAERQVRKQQRIDIAWEDRNWGGWSGKQWYDDNPDDDVYCYRQSGESDEDFARREAEATQQARQEYLEAVDKGQRIYSVNARGGDGMGGYRKAVPPPSFLMVDVLDDNGDPIYETKEVSVVDARVFRGTFYEAFTMKIRRRLLEAQRQAQKDAGEKVKDSESVALAIRDKKKEVEDAMEEVRKRVGKVGSYTGTAGSSYKRDHTGTAFEAGARAADAAPLGTSGRGVESS